MRWPSCELFRWVSSSRWVESEGSQADAVLLLVQAPSVCSQDGIAPSSTPWASTGTSYTSLTLQMPAYGRLAWLFHLYPVRFFRSPAKWRRPDRTSWILSSDFSRRPASCSLYDKGLAMRKCNLLTCSVHAFVNIDILNQTYYYLNFWHMFNIVTPRRE